MSGQGGAHDREYRQGYRDALGTIMRGLLRVEAEELDSGALIASLSRYEEAVDAWLASGAGEPSEWHPTTTELGAEEG